MRRARARVLNGRRRPLRDAVSEGQKKGRAFLYNNRALNTQVSQCNVGPIQSGTYVAPAPPRETSYLAPARAWVPQVQFCSPKLRSGPLRLAKVGPGGLGPCPLPCLQLGFVLLGRGPTVAPRPPQVSRGSLPQQLGPGAAATTRGPPPPIPRAARRFTQGRGLPKGDGPQASSRVGRPASVPRSPPSHGEGSVAPATRQQSASRAPVRNSPGWRALQDFCRRPLRSSGIRRAPCSALWPRPLNDIMLRLFSVCARSVKKMVGIQFLTWTLWKNETHLDKKNFSKD
ncbi:hypothetical protein NDU88_000323 [Pleurodeles waltl]|uniref:Uncharacterized protein n=1 Tax=Pleurodeles waltl TaxID=8319 RepID=A0AAV7TES5_PLEWA|nr:hypothetical protein NDU88_000323 [Pleurodeles waltl]